MSSSSATASESRSPSPRTPAPSAAHDIATAVPSEFWFASPKLRMSEMPWTGADGVLAYPQKVDDQSMLRLDELLEENAYDEPPQAGSDMASVQPSSTASSTPAPAPAPMDMVPVLTSYSPESNFLTAPAAPLTSTKPVPPPAPLPRRFDPNMFNQKVVYPPKEACFNLPVMFPSIPESGTKSRVETQIRVTMDLADGTATSESRRYDRVGTWKWLRLPAGTATKKPTRKQGKVEADPQDTLYLTANVSCASPPHSQVISCSSCRTREAKRVAKKIAARVKPQKSDGDAMDDKTQEDTTSILQFNCADTIEFSNGSVVLPIRITCYCRHHREKVGFRLNFSLVDHVGRLVGIGASPPIMITDDHKTAGASSSARHGDAMNGYPVMDSDWSQGGADQALKRKKRLADAGAKKKPYDSAGKPERQARQSSVASAPSPASSTSSVPLTRSPSPPSGLSYPSSEPPSHSQVPSLQNSSHESESSPDGPSTPLDYSPDIQMLSAVLQEESNPMLTPTTNGLQQSSMVPTPIDSYPFMYFGQAPAAPPALQIPTIHRLIPNTGPTHGGIEVTVLGANFHANVALHCVFGDVVASSTQRWSENTLVCILPPRATPGVVAVWIDGFPKADDPSVMPTSLFTYSDESDRALMELALQVVGLKMTGKIEDAKNVAMRIVGNTGDGSDQPTGTAPNSMQLATRELRPFLLQQVGENADFEKVITNFLSVMNTPVEHASAAKVSIPDALAYMTTSGQTLLHLAAFLKYAGLVQFLVDHGADIDARDRNGYTSLHVAALVGSKEVAACLLNAGADREIVNALGKTAEEVAADGFFDDIIRTDSPETVRYESEEEAHWGDAEEESEDEHLLRRRRQTRRRPSGHSTPVKKRSIARLTEDRPASRAGKQEKLPEKLPGVPDDKQAASLVEMIHKTFFPQLPLPQLPNFPQLPGVLQNIPVFPVYVPMMPNWAQLGRGGGSGEAESAGVGANAVKAAQDFRSQCDKWLAQVLQLQQAQQQQQQAEEDIAPPAYTPRRVVENGPEQAEGSRSRRRAEYDIHQVSAKEVASYSYQPTARQQQKLQKKQDRMLVLFWLPILFMSIIWGMFTGVQFAWQMFTAALPIPSVLRH
ncbi:hypothetical protein EV122DRAFT_262382 [Schizophyllum commune]